MLRVKRYTAPTTTAPYSTLYNVEKVKNNMRSSIVQVLSCLLVVGNRYKKKHKQFFFLLSLVNSIYSLEFSRPTAFTP